MAKPKMSVDEIITETIVARMEEEGLPVWRKPWSHGRSVSRAGHVYTGINAWLLPNGEYITFNQIKKESGKLTKGSKSQLVVGHIIKKEMRDGVEHEKYAGKRYYRVFNITDTDLEPKHSHIYEPKEATEKELEEQHLALGTLIENFCKFDGIFLSIMGSNRAYYSPSEDKIVVPKLSQYESVAEYYSTLSHEAVHSTGHNTRLKRFEHATFGDHSYSEEELVAEFGAGMLSAEYGVMDEQSLNNTAAYIKSWAKKLRDNPKWVYKASSQAKKAVEYIRERGSIITKEASNE